MTPVRFSKTVNTYAQAVAIASGFKLLEISVVADSNPLNNGKYYYDGTPGMIIPQQKTVELAGTVDSLSFTPPVPTTNVIYRANAGAGTYTGFLSGLATPMVVAAHDGVVDFIYNKLTGYWVKSASPQDLNNYTPITAFNKVDDRTLYKKIDLILGSAINRAGTIVVDSGIDRTDFLPVVAGDKLIITTGLWQSTVQTSDKIVIGFNSTKTSPQVLIDPRVIGGGTDGSVFPITNFELTIPESVSFIIIPSHKTYSSAFSVTKKPIVPLPISVVVDESVTRTGTFVADATMNRTPLLEVKEGDILFITTTLWQSTLVGSDKVICGYDSSNVFVSVLVDPRIVGGGTNGQPFPIFNHRLVIPSGISFISASIHDVGLSIFKITSDDRLGQEIRINDEVVRIADTLKVIEPAKTIPYTFASPFSGSVKTVSFGKNTVRFVTVLYIVTLPSTTLTILINAPTVYTLADNELLVVDRTLLTNATSGTQAAIVKKTSANFNTTTDILLTKYIYNNFTGGLLQPFTNLDKIRYPQSFGSPFSGGKRSISFNGNVLSIFGWCYAVNLDGVSIQIQQTANTTTQFTFSNDQILVIDTTTLSFINTLLTGYISSNSIVKKAQTAFNPATDILLIVYYNEFHSGQWGEYVYLDKLAQLDSRSIPVAAANAVTYTGTRLMLEAEKKAWIGKRFNYGTGYVSQQGMCYNKSRVFVGYDMGSGLGRIEIFDFFSGALIKQVNDLATEHTTELDYDARTGLMYVSNGNGGVPTKLFVVDIESATPTITRTYDFSALGTAGCSCLDIANNRIWVICYGPTTTGAVGQPLTFTPVDITSGTVSGTPFTLPSPPVNNVIQGIKFNNGKLLVLSGNASTELNVIDTTLATPDYVNRITVTPYIGEPEGLAVVDDIVKPFFLCGFNGLGVYNFYVV